MKENLIYESDRPIVFYLWIIASVLILFNLSYKLRFDLGTVVSSGLISLAIFLVFCRKACRIYVFSNRIYIKYIFFWNINQNIKFDEIVQFDFKKGMFDFSASFENTYHFKLICYDTFYFKLRTREVKIDVNTRIGGFNKAMKTMNETMLRITKK
jgi:hypothetical protein